MLCPRCGDSFSTKQALYYHLEKRKTKCNSYSCVKCKKNFSNVSDFRIHELKCESQNIDINTKVLEIFTDIYNTENEIEKWKLIHKMKGRFGHYEQYKQYIPLLEQFRPGKTFTRSSTNENIKQVHEYIKQQVVSV